MPAQVFWNPAPLQASVRQAFRDAAVQTARAIDATKPERRITVRGPVFTNGGSAAIIRSGGLAPIFEKGAKEHDIFPKGAVTLRQSRSKGQVVFKSRAIRGQTTTVLRLADGRFAAHVRHPGMAARPFQKPQANLFPARFRLAARLRLATTAGAAARRVA